MTTQVDEGNGIRIIYGVGINDTNYNLTISNELYAGRRHKVICPYYLKWRAMISRCYCEFVHKKQPYYIGCTVCDDWIYFSKFKAWMETQDWEGKVLDKDLLVEGNKVYSPETCVFISSRLNNFIIKGGKEEKILPIGVQYVKASNKYSAICNKTHLGLFETVEEAHQAWLSNKFNRAVSLAMKESDERVLKAVIERYGKYPEVKNV